MRKLKKTLRKTFLFGRVLIPKHARYKSDGRVNQGLCGNLAPGQDKVTQTDLFQPVMVDDALIDAFEPAAEQGDPLPGRPAPGHALGKGCAARRQADNRPMPPVRRRAFGSRAQGTVHHIGAQHHSGTAPGRAVIDIAVPPLAEAAQIKRLQRPQAELQRLARQAQSKRARESIGKKRDHTGFPGRGNHARLFHQVTRNGRGRNVQPPV